MVYLGKLGMELTASDLRGIADTIEKLAKLNAKIDTFSVGKYEIHIKRYDDPRDTWCVVTQILVKEQSTA